MAPGPSAEVTPKCSCGRLGSCYHVIKERATGITPGTTDDVTPGTAADATPGPTAYVTPGTAAGMTLGTAADVRAESDDQTRRYLHVSC